MRTEFIDNVTRREELGVPDVIWEARASTHKWIEKFDMTICERCLIVRRADGRHFACQGPAKMSLRDSTNG